MSFLDDTYAYVFTKITKDCISHTMYISDNELKILENLNSKGLVFKIDGNLLKMLKESDLRNNIFDWCRINLKNPAYISKYKFYFANIDDMMLFRFTF